MGFLDSVFGGGEEEATTEVKPWGPLRGPLRNLIKESERLGRIHQPMYPERMLAPLDPRQVRGMMDMETALSRAQAPMETALPAWASALAAPDVAENPYVQGMLESQRGLLGRSLEEDILPALSRNAAAMGARGGSRQGIAEGLAARGTQEALADAAARTQLGAYGQGLSAQQGAFQAGPSILNTATAPYTGMQGLGAQWRAQDQAELNEAIARHNYRYEEPWQRMQRSSAIPMGLSGTYMAQTTTSPTPSLFDKVLGTATTLGSAALGGGLFGGGGGGSGPAPMGIGRAAGGMGFAPQAVTPQYINAMQYGSMPTIASIASNPIMGF